MKTNEACSKSNTSEISGYAYDGAGNQTAITGYNDPASTSFSYNNLNQLKSLTPPSSAEQSLTDLGSGQSNLVALGSKGDVIGLLNSSGALVQSVRYSPYGENTTASGSASYSATNDAFLFQGGYHLAGGNAGTGNVPNNLYHYGERYYDPTTGRWTQPDPASGTTAFAFAGDDPINGTDPSGQSLVCDLEFNCELLHKIVAYIQHTGVYHAVAEETVSWSEFVHRLQTAFHVGKAVFGYGKCAYELAKGKGACPNP